MNSGTGKNSFDQLWKLKLEQAPDVGKYLPGKNLRVDKAISVLKRGRRILDIGCGSGLFLTQARNYFQEAYGIDISETAVELARKSGIEAQVTDLNTQTLSFEDNYFDCLTILSTLQYFYDLDGVLEECYRVLIPSGTLLLSVPNMRALWRVARLLFKGYFPRVSKDAVGYDGGTLHYFAYTNLEDLLTKNNFKILWGHGIFCKPTFMNQFPDRGLIGVVKREFFSAEIFIASIKQ